MGAKSQSKIRQQHVSGYLCIPHKISPRVTTNARVPNDLVGRYRPSQKLETCWEILFVAFCSLITTSFALHTEIRVSHSFLSAEGYVLTKLSSSTLWEFRHHRKRRSTKVTLQSYLIRPQELYSAHASCKAARFRHLHIDDKDGIDSRHLSSYLPLLQPYYLRFFGA
jgi:hypothetical protein